ncbi:hypothetical protein SO802_025079 [Lithocarpus litseifolius]|uniref:Uncharacterized protein n=1 Tax=Lithocarpus litseifolius TaxID=425828 RepID=A0AAW2BZ84_9ROSI
MSKADLKFEKKHQFYTEVRDTVAALSAQKAIEKKKKLRSRQKKLKAYDLSSLSEFLPELKTLWQPSPAAQFKLNCKSMQKLITQTVTDEKPKKKKNKNGGKKKKAKKSKASDGPQSMVMCFER